MNIEDYIDRLNLHVRNKVKAMGQHTIGLYNSRTLLILISYILENPIRVNASEYNEINPINGLELNDSIIHLRRNLIGAVYEPDWKDAFDYVEYLGKLGRDSIPEYENVSDVLKVLYYQYNDMIKDESYYYPIPRLLTYNEDKRLLLNYNSRCIVWGKKGKAVSGAHYQYTKGGLHYVKLMQSNSMFQGLTAFKHIMGEDEYMMTYSR